MADVLEVDEKVLDKIRKLLSLGQSSNESEASNAIEKAHELLRKYNLKISDISDKPEIQKKIIEEGGRQRKWKNTLLVGVAKSCYCAFIEMTGFETYKYKLYGRPGNIKTAEVMYEYLIDAIMRFATEAKKNYNISKAEYCEGMALRICERLQIAMIRENKECRDLVPVSNEALQFAKTDCNPIESPAKTIEANRSNRLGYMHGDSVSINLQIGV